MKTDIFLAQKGNDKRPDDLLRDACCGLDVFGYGGWEGREEVLCEIRWNALKK